MGKHIVHTCIVVPKKVLAAKFLLDKVVYKDSFANLISEHLPLVV